MTKYFEKFPLVEYNGKQIRDISRRINFLRKSVESPYVFLPYTIEEGDRPEDVAYYYYGSTDYTWLVYLSNNIIDPYNDWPLSEDDFNNYLIKKYEEQSGLSGYDVVAWTQDETIEDNIVYYYKEV
jgi:Base plate wedge protein 53.